MYSSRYAPKPTDTAPSPQPDSEEAPLSETVAQPSNTMAPEPLQASNQKPAPVESSYTMDPSIDEFAQTRPPDDLFDDDFTPIVESQAVYDAPPAAPEPTPQFSEPRYQEPPQQSYSHNRDLPRGVPRGPRGARGGRRGGNERGGMGRSSPPKTTAPAAASAVEPAPTTKGATSTIENTPPTEAPPLGTPAGPKKDTTAVRGDRSLTGGPPKTKLTESELNAKLAAMSLKNKALTEAHEKAQADQEAFSARERMASERRKEERANRQVLMGEREKNRMRKLQALGGREWDAEKNEDDFRDDGRRARRGAHGGVVGARNTAPEMEVAVGGDEGSNPRGSHAASRGRGRGGRGRGRGEHHQNQGPKAEKAPNIPTAADFPDLPVTSPPPKVETPQAPKTLDFPNKKKAETTDAKDDSKEMDAKAKEKEKPQLITQTSFGFSPATEKRSWADQVEGASP